MRTSIHPLAFLLGSLLLSVTWLVLRTPPPEAVSKSTAFGTAGPAPRPHVERKTIVLDPAVLRRYIGSYRLDLGMDVALEIEGGKLIARSETAPPYELHATSETEFYIPDLDADLTFDVEGSGRAVSFTVQVPTGTIVAKRTR